MTQVCKHRGGTKGGGANGTAALLPPWNKKTLQVQLKKKKKCNLKIKTYVKL